MATIPQITSDPTLEAADRALEDAEANRPPRAYLGMSGIGHPCSRKIWYDWRWFTAVRHDARTLKRFADGNAGEDVQAARLRLVPGLTLLTIEPETGRQFGYSDHGGHFKGHADGKVLGLLQAASTWHIWEHKQVGDDKQAKLAKLKTDRGEKQALAAWDEVYYAQAVLYMHYSGLTRHYLTCSTPGGRETISVRTNADEAAALRLIAKAERIIGADNPPERAFNDATFYMCKWCDHAATCWHEAIPVSNCRTCMRSTPVADGAWHCAKYDDTIPLKAQRTGCGFHLHIPAALGGKEQIDIVGDGEGIVYRCADGSEWCDGIPF